MEELIKKGICGASNLPINSDLAWDSKKAILNMRKKASSDGSGDKDKINYTAFGKGFVYVDPENKDNLGGYKLPFADVVNGKLTAIWKGVVAAMVAVNGGRGGVSMSDSDKKKAYNFLAAYYKRFKKEIPAKKNYEEDIVKSLLNQDIESHPVNMSVILKQDDEKQVVYGAVLVPEVVDLQGEIISEADIEKAAYDYMIRSRNIDTMHIKNATSYVVESYLAPVDMNIGGSIVKKGTWIMGVYIPDRDIWGQVKIGKLKGFSIYGLANVEEEDVAATNTEE